MNQVETHYVLHQWRNEKSMKINGADPWSYNGQKYIRNQMNTATREDTNAEYIPPVALYFSIVRADQDEQLKYVANFLNMIGPMIIKSVSLLSDAEKFDQKNVCLYYNSWETQIFHLLIRYFLNIFYK